MKLKALVAALALASGAAHAGYANHNDTTQASSLIFSAYNSTTTGYFDLGLTSAQFTAANFGGVAAGYVPAAGFELQTLQVTWNFTTGSVLSTGQFDVSSLLAGVSGDWSAAWSQFQPQVASSQWDVFAYDRNGTLANQQFVLTTSPSTAAAIGNTTGAQLVQLNTMSTWLDNQQLTGGGNHGTVANGANVITNPSSVLHQGATGGMKTNWNGKLTSFTATGSATTELGFYGLVGTTNTGKVAVTNYNGKFALNGDNGTLTWTTTVAAPVTAPIPEASTYAMLLAGLGLMGVVARRRVK